MDEAFYTRYSHGSAEFGGAEHARLLAQGRGPIARLGGETLSACFKSHDVVKIVPN